MIGRKLGKRKSYLFIGYHLIFSLGAVDTTKFTDKTYLL